MNARLLYSPKSTVGRRNNIVEISELFRCYFIYAIPASANLDIPQSVVPIELKTKEKSMHLRLGSDKLEMSNSVRDISCMFIYTLRVTK